MKKMMLTSVIAMAGLAIVNANQTETILNNNVPVDNVVQMVPSQENDKRTLVEPENLPQGIKTALSAEEYTGWTVATAYHVEPEEKDAYYEISLQKEGEEDLRVVKMSEDGQVKGGEITPPSLP